jgi:hypothetical protein
MRDGSSTSISTVGPASSAVRCARISGVSSLGGEFARSRRVDPLADASGLRGDLVEAVPIRRDEDDLLEALLGLCPGLPPSGHVGAEHHSFDDSRRLLFE